MYIVQSVEIKNRIHTISIGQVNCKRSLKFGSLDLTTIVYTYDELVVMSLFSRQETGIGGSVEAGPARRAENLFPRKYNRFNPASAVTTLWKMEEASSSNNASSSGSNDNDQHQCNDTSRWKMVDEEMEALCDVDFPIFDKSAKAEHHHDDIKDDGKNSNSTNNKLAGDKVVDEDAIIRCFDLSIKSHVDGSSMVPVFKPMPPEKNNDDK